MLGINPPLTSYALTGEPPNNSNQPTARYLLTVLCIHSFNPKPTAKSCQHSNTATHSKEEGCLQPDNSGLHTHTPSSPLSFPNSLK